MNRLSFKLWVTEQCNLRCRYCYVSKNANVMNEDIINKSIMFVNKEMKKYKEKELIISFHGGEPLLNFDGIKLFTEYMTDHFKNRVFFQLITNGTIINEEIYDYLVKNKFRISVSIDGNKECNDLNRIKIDGTGSFDSIIKTIDYFKQQKYGIRIRMTINSSNVHLFSDSFIYLFEKNAGAIAMDIDTYNKTYNDEFWSVYEAELYKIIDYLEKYHYDWYRYYINVFRDFYFSPKEICTGGENSFHIDSLGFIYPCIMAVQNKDMCIGHVEEGINSIKLKELQSVNIKRNPSCEQCGARKVCSGESCKIINKLDTGDYFQPCNYNCKIIAIYNRLIQKRGR